MQEPDGSIYSADSDPLLRYHPVRLIPDPTKNKEGRLHPAQSIE